MDGLAPIAVYSGREEMGRVARGGIPPRQGDILNLSSRSHGGRLLAYQVTGVERWYGDVGPASARTFAGGEVIVRVMETDTKPAVPGWLGANPFAPVVLLYNDIELGRIAREAEPPRGEIIRLDSHRLGHRLGPPRTFRVLRVERWPANLGFTDPESPVFEWGDVGVHLVELKA